MGYAGNAEPSYIIPSTIAVGGADSGATVRSRQGIDDLDFYIGNEVQCRRHHLVGRLMGRRRRV